MSARSISTAFAVFVVLGAAGWLMATMARTDRADRYLLSIAGVLIGGLIIAFAVSYFGRRGRKRGHYPRSSHVRMSGGGTLNTRSHPCGLGVAAGTLTAPSKE